jgi:hypothetical protein
MIPHLFVVSASDQNTTRTVAQAQAVHLHTIIGMQMVSYKPVLGILDPDVFGPPGSGSISQRFVSGSISQRYGSRSISPRYGSGSFSIRY